MTTIHYLGDSNPGPRGGKIYEFHCPGCGYAHPFEIECGEFGWTWNGSLDKPTFKPSLMVWRDVPERRCHCFVTDGKIEFQKDCHHKLAGQTVDIPDLDG